MGILDVIIMLGGLAMFLYGMDQMGAGLRKVAGGRLESLLEKLTGKTLHGVLLGAGVTAIIQSSSATTVMVVGFVNSGIMTLRQAVGVILGANIGTTITSWLLAASGIESDLLILDLLSADSLGAICGVIGIAMVMFSKNDRKKDVGLILAAFCALLFGMDIMSGAVKPLANDPAFAQVFTMFANPILAMLAGLILTSIIQSSSAATGIVQAISITGTLTMGATIPMLIGINIGTCVTAMISSAGTSRNARRAALVHLYFNIITGLLFMIPLVILKYTADPAFLGMSINSLSIAVLHSVFNIVGVAVIFPFTRQLEQLAYSTIPEPAGEKHEKGMADYELAELDARFLATPGIALERCRSVGSAMASMTRGIMVDALGLFEKWDDEAAKRIIKGEDDGDRLEDKLGAYLVEISSRPLTAEDSAEASLLLHAIGDWERISDHAKQILGTVEEMREKSVRFSDEAQAELDILFNAVRETLTLTVHAFCDGDRKAAIQVEPLIQVSETIKKSLRSRHIARLQRGECTIELGFIFSDLLTSIERVGAHCSNIAIGVLETNPHAYVDHLKTEDDDYGAMVREYNERYALPAAK